jgi:hypothetical protein
MWLRAEDADSGMLKARGITGILSGHVSGEILRVCGANSGMTWHHLLERDACASGAQRPPA